MLTHRDEPIIRRALMRRLDVEPGVRVLEVIIKALPAVEFEDLREKPVTHIAVGVLWLVQEKILGKSVFDLPPEFIHRHLLNEADEIAEACKEARRKLLFTGGQGGRPEIERASEIHQAKGTGRRGNWRLYGERSSL